MGWFRGLSNGPSRAANRVDTAVAATTKAIASRQGDETLRTRFAVRWATRLTSAVAIVTTIAFLSSDRLLAASIRAGDTIVVLTAAPLMDGSQTLLTIVPGKELNVTDVRDQWVAVVVDQNGKRVSGWVSAEHVKRAEDLAAEQKKEREQEQATLQAVREIARALERYKNDLGDYPTTEQGLHALLTRPANGSQVTAWKGPYLTQVPKEPRGGEFVFQRREFDVLAAPRPPAQERQVRGYCLRMSAGPRLKVYYVPKVQFGDIPEGAFFGPVPAAAMIGRGVTIGNLPTARSRASGTQINAMLNCPGDIGSWAEF
jgi:hypothetical protein